MYKDDPTLPRLTAQSMILAVFYTLWTGLTWMMVRLFQDEITNDNLCCIKNKYILVLDRKGAWWLFFFTLLLQIQALIVMSIFYEVPKRCFNQYAALDVSDIKADPLRSSMLIASQGDRPFKDLLKADQEEEDFIKGDIRLPSDLVIRKTSASAMGDLKRSPSANFGGDSSSEMG
jgi:hypothetical protein